jgi:hypothetical protein
MITGVEEASAGVRRETGPALLLAVVLIAGFFGLRLATHGWQPSAFVVAGDMWTDPAARPELVVAPGSAGYDGQFVYRLALDPLLDTQVGDGIRLDNPPYRQGRIGLPALAWVVDRLPGVSLPWALVLIEGLALLGSAWLGIRYAADLGRSPYLGLLVGLSPGLLMAAARDLTEPLSVALLLAGLYAWQRRRLIPAGLLFAGAALTRETALVVLAGMGLWQLRALAVRRDSEHLARAATLLVPLAAALAWQGVVRSIWGSPPSASKGGSTFGIPVYRPLGGFFAGAGDPLALDRAHLLAHLWVAERIALAVLIVAVLAVLRTSAAAPDLRTGWVFAAILALTMPWRADIQFVRAANEAIVVGLLVLMGTRGRWPAAALATAAVWSTAVAIAYGVAL